MNSEKAQVSEMIAKKVFEVCVRYQKIRHDRSIERAIIAENPAIQDVAKDVLAAMRKANNEKIRLQRRGDMMLGDLSYDVYHRVDSVERVAAATRLNRKVLIAAKAEFLSRAEERGDVQAAEDYLAALAVMDNAKEFFDGVEALADSQIRETVTNEYFGGSSAAAKGAIEEVLAGITDIKGFAEAELAKLCAEAAELKASSNKAFREFMDSRSPRGYRDAEVAANKLQAAVVKIESLKNEIETLVSEKIAYAWVYQYVATHVVDRGKYQGEKPKDIYPHQAREVYYETLDAEGVTLVKPIPVVTITR